MTSAWRARARACTGASPATRPRPRGWRWGCWAPRCRNPSVHSRICCRSLPSRMPSIEEMTSTGNSAAKSATMSNWSRPTSWSRKPAITRVTSGSRSSIAFLVNTVRTSLRSRSCSGGSMMIIMLVVHLLAHRQDVHGHAVRAAERLPVPVRGDDVRVPGQGVEVPPVAVVDRRLLAHPLVGLVRVIEEGVGERVELQRGALGASHRRGGHASAFISRDRVPPMTIAFCSSVRAASSST